MNKFSRRAIGLGSLLALLVIASLSFFQSKRNNGFKKNDGLPFYHEEVSKECEGLGYEFVDESSFISADKNYSAFLVRCMDKSGELFGQHVLILSSDEQLIESPLKNDSYINFVGLWDVNSDDYQDLVLEFSTGGNGWSETRQEIIQFNENGIKLLTQGINSCDDGLAIRQVVDLDKDNKEELIVSDSKWEMAFGFCHGCSPSIPKVFRWNGERYIEDSKKYSSFYKQLQEKIEKRWLDNNCVEADYYGSTENCLSHAIGFLLASDASGERDVGWNFFWQKTDPSIFGDNGKSPSFLMDVRETLEEQYKAGKEFGPN